jgi:hypothetical protein
MGQAAEKRAGNALQGLSTANRKGKPAERLQEILTPQCIVDVANKVWKHIWLDPCWAEGSITAPYQKYMYPEQDGLSLPWRAGTFINPPYKDLKAWLAHGQKQFLEQIWLVPVRTHRKWWRQWRDDLSCYVELNPIKFLGYDQVFPAPLLLGYVGTHAAEFGAAAAHLGSYYERR